MSMDMGLGDIFSTIGQYIMQSDQQQHDTDMFKKYMNYNTYMNKNDIIWDIEQANKLGLHPLAVLGKSPGFNTQLGRASAVPQVGRTGLGKLIQGLMSRRQRKQQMDDENTLRALAIGQANEKLKQLNLESQSMRLDLQDRKKDVINRNEMIPGQADAPPQKHGAELTLKPAKQWFEDPLTRTIQLAPSEDFKNAIEDNLFYELPDFLRTASFSVKMKYVLKRPWTKQAHALQNQLRSILPQVDGYRFLYDPTVNAFRKTKNYAGDKRQFYWTSKGLKKTPFRKPARIYKEAMPWIKAYQR